VGAGKRKVTVNAQELCNGKMELVNSEKIRSLLDENSDPDSVLSMPPLGEILLPIALY
jgi:hypothetical protein